MHPEFFRLHRGNGRLYATKDDSWKKPLDGKIGFVLDDECLKNHDGRPDYYDELFERIGDIRASENRFYQKVRDLFALSSDYGASDKSTQMFFAKTLNKLLFAATGKTVAEIVVSRADANMPKRALISRKGKIVRKQDIAKSMTLNKPISKILKN
jgi:hypothetical protein